MATYSSRPWSRARRTTRASCRKSLTWSNQAIREIQAGVTWVNQIHYGYDELPFGGVKASGMGHEHGPEAVDYYLEKKGAVIGGLS